MAGETTYKFFLSKDVDLPVKVKISYLEGGLCSINNSQLRSNRREHNEDMFVRCELQHNDFPLCFSTQTHYQPLEYSAFWNQWLSFPVKYNDLPAKSTLRLSLFTILGPGQATLIGHADYPLFSPAGKLKKGRQKIKLCPPSVAVPRPTENCRSGPAVEVDRLEKLVKKYESHKIPHVDWLDRVAFNELEKIKEQHLQNRWKQEMFIFVEFPTFELPVVHSHMLIDLPVARAKTKAMNKLVVVQDDVKKQNPVEMKHLKLARSYAGLADMDLKPDRIERQRINEILAYAPMKSMAPPEKELLWKFRYFISKDKLALAKFLRCVDWSDQRQVDHGVELMHLWEPIDPSQALELLTKRFSHVEVKKYAVERLAKGDDEEILSYLLQLVQALHYDNGAETPLTNFLISRCSKNIELAEFFYWYIKVELDKPGNRRKIYAKCLRKLMLSITVEEEGKALLQQVKRGQELVQQLSKMQKQLQQLPHSRPRKIATMRDWLSSRGQYQRLANFEPLALPISPSVVVSGIVAEKATMFKSALAPLGLRFKCTEAEEEYMILFKSGDDMRQDQLVVQLITLMDKLLKRENLDLKLTPYRVLATSFCDGMVECISPSTSIASVLKKYDGNIQKYLRDQSPGDGDYNIDPEVLDTFVKSCAGYCVITYILGIGDRHLDNLLITPKGNLFHIDFGFILGNDPKPFPPPMKLCKEMVEGMGGASSVHYQRFKEHCCEAYNILRKSANLILHLFQLMVDADIPDIAEDPKKSILKVQEKFKMELNDEEAGKFFQGLITESVKALFPQITETIHRWAQYWRS